MFKYLRAGFLSLVAYFGSFSAYAQASSPIPPKPDFSKEAFVVELDANRATFENDGTDTRQLNRRIRIQSDAGVQQLGVLTLSYQSSDESLAIDYVRVTKPDGTVVNTPPDDVQDMVADITRQAPFYSDLHEKHIAVKGLGVGDTLELQATWHLTKPLAPGEFWFSFDFPRDAVYLQQQLQISVPRTRAIKWKSFLVQPVITDDGAYRRFIWTTSHLQGPLAGKEKDKDDEETLYNVGRGLLPAPDVQLSSFQTWNDVARWYNALQQDRVKPTPEIQAKAADLIKDAATPDAKIRAIYNYVSTNFRYIGIGFGVGRYQPHFANEVFSNGFGDCKDKHTLLASLLTAAGIKVFPALINSQRVLDPDVPSPLQFDHVITAVPQDQDYLWLDTTAEVAPYGYLLSLLRDKPALIIRDNAPSVLVRTPANPPAPALTTFQIKAKLDDSGTLEGKVERSDQGTDMEVLLRAAFRRVPFQQWKDLFQRISYNSGFAGDVSDGSAARPEKTDEPFTFSYAYKRKDYPDWADRRISPPLPPVVLPAVPDDDSAPSHPYWFGSPSQMHFTSEVELPKGYSPQTPKNVDIKEDFAEYHADYSIKDGSLVTDRRLILKLAQVPSTEYAAYKKFYKAVNDDHAQYIPLVSGNPSSVNYEEEIWRLPYSENAAASQAYDEARADFQRNDTQAQIDALHRAVQADTKFIRAWLWLGNTYKYGHQLDLAVEADRKAIEIDPKVTVSYKALGFTLMMQFKFNDALPVWQELIKIAPEEPGGPTGLGFTLYNMKRYQDAIPQLESALKLSPKEAGAELALADCYLQTGQAEKAMPAFKIGIAQNPDPALLAHIAYQIADAKVDLDLALEFAQSAVNDLEKSTQSLQLDKLQPQDLVNTAALSHAWATMGWVLQQKGESNIAEKYLEAAWNLTQSPQTAYHLGLVYEAQKKKTAALGIYHMGLAGSLPPEDKTLIPIRARLKDLGETSAASQHASFHTQDQLAALTMTKLPRILPGTESAEVDILLGAGSKVLDTKFISGSDKMKEKLQVINTVNFHQPFPDDATTRIVRQGILGCYEFTGCSLVLLPLSQIQTGK